MRVCVRFDFDRTVASVRRYHARNAKWNASSKYWLMGEAEAAVFISECERALVAEGRTHEIMVKGRFLTVGAAAPATFAGESAGASRGMGALFEPGRDRTPS